MKLKLFIIYILCFLLGGCTMSEEKNIQKKETLTKEEVQQQMLQHVQDKYQQEFDVLAVEYKSWAYNYEKMLLREKNKENELDSFRLYRYTNEDGSVSYKDGYVGILNREKYENYVSERLNQYIDDYKLQVNFNFNTSYPEDMQKEISFADFKEYMNNNKNVLIHIFIVSDNEKDIENSFQLLLEDLKSNIGMATLNLYGVNQEDYDKWEQANHTEIVSRNNFNLYDSWGTPVAKEE